MDSHYFEFEKLHVTKAICLTFHGLDFVVGTLEGTVGDREIVIVQKPFSVFRKGSGVNGKLKV